MAEEKHALAPWSATSEEAGDEFIDVSAQPASNGGFIVARCYGEHREANARLIVAAPDLLKIVRLARGNVASLGPAGALADLPVYTCYREWLDALDAAIAKATGSASHG